MIKQNVISFSLWGSNLKYLNGAIENCKLAPQIYPDWKVRIYIDESISMEMAKTLHDLGAEVLLMQEKRGPFWGAYWRFLVADDESVDRFIIRDCDSRLNLREKAAVEDWMASYQPFHIMRDHVNHVYPIQGGMWGGRVNANLNMVSLINKYASYDRYSCDQLFLAYHIYPIIRDAAKVHCPFHENKPFPPHPPINEGGFVGQIWDENGVPQPV